MKRIFYKRQARDAHGSVPLTCIGQVYDDEAATAIVRYIGAAHLLVIEYADSHHASVMAEWQIASLGMREYD